MRRTLLIMGLAAGVALIAGSGGSFLEASTSVEFDALVDRYLAEVRGVGAGVEAHDMSAAAFGRDVEVQRRLLGELRQIDRDTLSFDEDIDWRFLESILRGNIIRGENVQRWRQDPRGYLGISRGWSVRPNRLNYLLTVDPRAPEARAADLLDGLQLMQVRLQNGERNLRQPIHRWVELADDLIEGLVVVLENSLPAFAGRLQSASLRQELLDESVSALAALNDYREFINTDLMAMPEGDFRIGADVFNDLHEARYLFPEDNIHLRRIALGSPGFTRVPGYHDWGWKQFEIIKHHLEVKASRIDPERTWLQILRDEKEDHLQAEQLVYEHHEAARASRDWVIDNDLVSIPWDDDDSIMEAADPSRWSSQWWGFGPGVPAGQTITRKSAWRIIPVAPDWPDDIAEQNLSEKDASFMYAIATHEVYPGHHLQSLYRNENPRRLRVYAGSYSNQSWCYYVEWELTPDPKYGWFPPDKQEIYALETLRLKLWRLGRVIIDSGLHTGRMTYDEAVELESETIGFVLRGAQINIDGITGGGSRTAAPTVGYYQWMLLREDYFQKMRELNQRGTLKDFHDRVYKIGFLPVVLVRETMFHDLEEEFS
jgi:hypothetical protein